MGGFGGVCKEGLKKGGDGEGKEIWGLKLMAMPFSSGSLERDKRGEDF